MSAHPSVPRWVSEPPAVDTAGRSFAVLSFGDGRRVAERWVASIGPERALWTRHAERADDSVLAALREQVERARVGWRLMLAGPEADVLPAQSVALRHGAVPAEVRVHVTSTRDKRVHCPHCRDVTRADLAVDETVPCDGCDRELVVYHHVSRRLGAYLGFMVDAEDR